MKFNITKFSIPKLIYQLAFKIFRLKSVEDVLNSLQEIEEIMAKHREYLLSFETMPAKIDRLRAIHSQLLVT